MGRLDRESLASAALLGAAGWSVNAGLCPVCKKRPAHRARRGMCEPCYVRARLAAADACSVDGCSKPARTRGMCDMHYCRLKRAGALPPLPPRTPPPRCSERGCSKMAVACGMCKRCYNAAYRARRRAAEAEVARKETRDRARSERPTYGGADTPLEVFMARQRAALAGGRIKRGGWQ